MKHWIGALLFVLPSLASAQSSLDRSKEFSAERTELTSSFAKAQAQLKSRAKADWSAGEATLVEIGPKIEALRDRLKDANQSLIQAFGSQPFHGTEDPSATIVASLAKLNAENRELETIKIPGTPPFNAQDLNQIQRALDRIRKGIDEHRMAAANHATTLTQRKRKPIEPAKTVDPKTKKTGRS